MQELRKRVVILLSDKEHTLLMSTFLQFLDSIGRRGANFAELQILLGILRLQKDSDKADELLEGLLGRVIGLLETVMPDPLTLEEASDIYGVKAATLRRACWSGKLPAIMRGKTWFVSSSDLEQYFATSKKKRTRRSQ